MVETRRKRTVMLGAKLPTTKIMVDEALIELHSRKGILKIEEWMKIRN